MNRIDETFKKLKNEGTAAFIAYITAGDPDLKTTGRLALALERSGVDILELGIPFSDPVADGPTIQAASQRALKNGTNLASIFAMTALLRKKTKMPIVFMSYVNPIMKYGFSRFVRECVRTGVDGIIIPDLPYEEAGELLVLTRRANVALIFLAAPTSTPARLKQLASKTAGFLYYVSLTGVTGERRSLPPEVLSRVRALRSMTGKPVCVGFGISDRSQARVIAAHADGVIVGSAIVKIIETTPEGAVMITRVEQFARSLAAGVHQAHEKTK
ncbi:MAG: tryptophan synthase subunit alpha [Candidatus Omnitrophota bacterium]